MNFPGYQAYQDTEVEWLGKVPAHWNMVPLKYLCSFSGGGTPAKENLEYWNGNIPWVSPKDMKLFDISNSIDKITAVAVKESSTSLVEPGALLMVVRSGILQRTIPIGVNSVDVTINQDMKALRFFASGFEQYFAYLIKGFESSWLLEWRKQGATVESIEQEYLESSLIPVPPVSDLVCVLAFLDHETAKIDTLIHEQKRLIELLKEKRQAVISHAVTKGLDPDVPMKDSGVEWFGEVPAHWTKKRLKNVSPFIAVGIVVNPSSYVAEDGLPFIYGGEVKEGYIDLSKTRKISTLDSKKNKKTILETGDLVTMRVGYPGVTAIVPPSCEGGNCASVMLVKRGDFDSRWLCAVMNSRLIRRQVEVVQYGAAQKQFNIADAVEFWLLKPPQTEQAEIADFIATKSAGFDQLMNKASQSMGLLAERRSALISAAVTGKIDVRNWQPPADESAFEEVSRDGQEATA